MGTFGVGGGRYLGIRGDQVELLELEEEGAAVVGLGVQVQMGDIL